MFAVRSRTGASAVLLLAAVLGLACGTTDNAVGPTSDGDPSALVSEVRATPTEIRVGETMQIEVEVHNPTALPIRMHFTSGCIVVFAVRDLDGQTVAPVWVCTAHAPTLVIAPGETLTSQFQWDGRVSGPSTPGLEPGEYRVVGGFDPGVQRNESDPVAIRILAP